MARFYKKSLLLLSLITFHLSLLTSCQEGREAGDLFGQWRLEGLATCSVSGVWRALTRNISVSLGLSHT